MTHKQLESLGARFYQRWELLPWLSELLIDYAALPNGEIWKCTDDYRDVWTKIK